MRHPAPIRANASAMKLPEASDFCICIKRTSATCSSQGKLARFEEGTSLTSRTSGREKRCEGTERSCIRRPRLRRNRDSYPEERDHEVNEKFSLQSEVKSTVDEKVKWTRRDATLNTAMLSHSLHTPTSPRILQKSESQSVARSYAKDLVTGRLEDPGKGAQAPDSARSLVSREKNLHSIDTRSRGGSSGRHLYWVNKVSHAQVYNYGKHMMFGCHRAGAGCDLQEVVRAEAENDKTPRSAERR